MNVIDELLQRVSERIAHRSFPEATYRLQFHAGFTFQDARAIVPYLHDLGISHIYASPLLKARRGSTHGYDIVDHRSLNPEIGGEADFDALAAELDKHGMGLILDMVPNHMGIAGNENVWWNDVLENGPSSPFAGYFDIAWRDAPRPELNNRVLLPVLGEPYGEALEARKIQLHFEDGTFFLQYYDRRFPMAPRSYAMLLDRRLADLEQKLGSDAPPWHEYQSIRTAVSHLPGFDETDPARIAELRREKEVVKRRLGTLCQECPEVRAAIDETVALFNGEPDKPHSFDLLETLLGQQAYRLSYWRVAADEINYRRFFDVNDLAALNMEKLDVFQATHELVLRLLCQGKIDGLRIDHPDGLFNPREYLHRLQQYYVLALARQEFDADPKFRTDPRPLPAAERGEDEGKTMEWQDLEGPLLEQMRALAFDNPLYVVVEKILAPAETLPADWQTNGTSGYDFLNMINTLFVDPAGEEPLTNFYRSLTGDDGRFADMVYAKKSLILRDTLSSELHMLGRQLDRLAQKNRHSRDFTSNSLRFGLHEVIACFSVYRSYISDQGVHDTDRRYVELAVARAMRRNPTVTGTLFRFVRDMLLLNYPEAADEVDRAEQLHMAGKFQQVTAPVMAKGLEDTAYFIYNRLVSLNEVGGDPRHFGISADDLHRYLQDRRTHWPYAMSTLSTHDTKRSEDVRARLNVVPEMAQEWQESVTRWRRLNERHCTAIDDSLAPDANEEYLIYQTLVGAWPFEPCAAETFVEFVERIQAFMSKALREAKVHTSWINPHESYDEAVRQFVARILDPQVSGEFLRDVRKLVKRLSHFGLLSSLSQTLLKIASPGVPDAYQGTESWDFSLVEPDNRRPVDFAGRRAALKELDERLAVLGGNRRELARELIQAKQDGRVKIYVTSQALRCRRDSPGLFSTGQYAPATIEGSLKEHAFAFARKRGSAAALVVVPRFMTHLAAGESGLPLGEKVWQDTRVCLPFLGSGQRWQNVFTGQTLSATHHEDQAVLPLSDVFADFPVALLIPKRQEG